MATLVERESIKEIGERLKRGEVGILPCDTILGLCSGAKRELGDRIYEIKERPRNKSFITLATFEGLKELDLDIPEEVYALWPAPLTVIAKKRGGEETVAVRVPDDEELASILAISGPIFSTSVNISGESAMSDIEEIIRVFGDKVDFIVNASGKQSSVSSTLVDCTKKPYRILRQGSYQFPLEAI